MRKMPPIRVVVERIDGERLAVVAYCYKVARRRFNGQLRPYLYGWSMWMLVDRPIERWRAEEIGNRLILAEAEKRMSVLPGIGWCFELPGWAEYE